MAAGLPTANPIGNTPYSTPITDGELMRDVLWNIGDSATGPSNGIKGFLDGLALRLPNAFANATGIGLGPTNCIAQPYPRYMINNAAQANQNAKILVAAIWLPQNFVVNNFNFLVGTTGDTAPTNQWMCLLNSSRVSVAVSADATTTAITASTTTAPVTVSYPVATVAAGAGTQYVTPSAGVYYVGLAVNGQSTLLTSGFTGLLEGVNTVPILAGTSTATTTTPIAVGGSAQTAITGLAAIPYFWLT